MPLDTSLSLASTVTPISASPVKDAVPMAVDPGRLRVLLERQRSAKSVDPYAGRQLQLDIL